MAILPFLLAVVLAGAPGGAAPGEADLQIRFWEARFEKADPEDPITPTKLGVAYLRKARECGDSAYYEKAEKVLRQAHRLQPDGHETQVALAFARAAQHDFREALALAAKAIAARPDAADAYVIQADASLETGDLPRAEAACRKLLALVPGLSAYSCRANLQEVRGDTRGALASLASALAAGKAAGVPADELARCRVRMGDLHRRAGRWKEAEREYHAALKLTPDGTLAEEHLAELRAAQGRWDEALALYRKVLARAPRPEFEEAIAGVYAASGLPGEAEACKARALAGYLESVERGEVVYYRQLAHYFSEVAPDPPAALKWARKDLEVRASAESYHVLAWAHYRSSDFKAAAAAIRRALAPGTQEAELHFHAGMIQWRAGAPGPARFHLQRALALNPRFTSAAEARRILQRLPTRRR